MKRQITGIVSGDKMDKTVVVDVERRIHHRRYGKTIRRTASFKAHDEKNECRVGDRVRLEETRPLSKEKRWRVIDILEKGGAQGAQG